LRETGDDLQLWARRLAELARLEDADGDPLKKDCE
jgi:hypothetical protein